MSVEMLRTYRYRCDATGCPSEALAEEGAPADWTVVSSIAHHVRPPLPPLKSPRSRLRATSADGARSLGQFKLHLCPNHPDALAGHLPRTDNLDPAGKTQVKVSCSCGAKVGFMLEDPREGWRRHYEEARRLTDGAQQEVDRA
ncbi:hypothetical protein ACFVWR_18325 [Leifsonia sp. NPDC058292]|uniref:hypothetical protein n=1 Tax=Leifsonia sp. NPDC058292 TaxID=3346428 RepID=UPI0036D842A3